MIFKGMRMKIILFYLDFLCRFYRAIILSQPNIRINMLYMLFFLSQRFGWQLSPAKPELQDAKVIETLELFWN